MSTAKPAMKLDQHDLNSIHRAIGALGATGNEFNGKIATYAAVLTVKYDGDAGQHVVTAVEAR